MLRHRLRLAVRARLALLLASLAVSTGLVLVATNFLLIRASLIGALSRAVSQPPRSPGGPGDAGQHAVSTSVSNFLALDWLLLAAVAAVAGGLAWLMAGRMLRPLRRITETARRITGQDLHERLALGGPRDELTELGDTFDAMLARLEAAFTDQQLFSANAAHELRTPLAVMRAELDLLLTGPEPSPQEVAEVAARLRRTVLDSERLLERLLTLTRGLLAPGDREPVALDQIVRESLAAADEAARARGVTIRAALREARTYGDPWLLGELATNLLSNAINYNRPDGWIAVDTHAEQDHVVLEISNSGQPVAEADLARLVEPFRRAGRQRTGAGSGLGLSIVRSVVAAHGGQLALHAVSGGGLALRVSLPAIP